MKKILLTVSAIVAIATVGRTQCSITGLTSPTCVTANQQTPVVTGGTLVGPGVSGGTFDPAVAGVGTHQLFVVDPTYAPDLYYLDQTGTFGLTPGSGTTVSLGDDQVSGIIPIGFTFNFFGVDYTDFYLSSNGFLTFNNDMNSACCSGQPIPDVNSPNNFIAWSWDDMYPPGAGSYQYFVTGSAPNQKLIINFFDIPFCCGTTPTVKMQIVLFETTNIIEIHTEYANNVNPGTMGIENVDGTVGYSVPGRNGEAWPNLVNDYVAFIPTYCDVISVDVTAATVANLGADFSLCPGETAYVSPALGMTSYLWDDASTDDSLAISAPGQYYVDIVDLGGCADSDTINVSVASITNLTTPLAVCEGAAPIVLTATPVTNPSPNDDTQGVWSGLGVLSSGVNIDTVKIFDVPGGGLEDTLTWGPDLCSDGITGSIIFTSPAFTLQNLATSIDSIGFTFAHTSCDVSYDWNIYVNGVLVETIAGTNPNTCSCVPSTNLEIIVATNPAIEANWNFGGSNTIGIEYTNFSGNFAGTFAQVYSQGNIFDPVVAGPGVHTITYSICSLTEQFDINVMGTPTISATDSVFICNGNPVTLSSDITPGMGCTSWSTAETTDAILVNTPGWYYLDNTCCGTEDSIEIFTSPDIIVSSSTTDEILGNDGTIDLTVSGGTPGFTFDWDNSATTEDLSGLAGGTYTVTVTDANACYVILPVNVSSQVGVDEENSSFGVSLYPNPSDGMFKLSIDSKEADANASVQILNSTGQVVFTNTMNVNAGINTTEIDLSKYASGIYLVRITIAETTYVTQITLN